MRTGSIKLTPHSTRMSCVIKSMKFIYQNKQSYSTKGIGTKTKNLLSNSSQQNKTSLYQQELAFLVSNGPYVSSGQVIIMLLLYISKNGKHTLNNIRFLDFLNRQDSKEGPDLERHHVTLFIRTVTNTCTLHFPCGCFQKVYFSQWLKFLYKSLF